MEEARGATIERPSRKRERATLFSLKRRLWRGNLIACIIVSGAPKLPPAFFGQMKPKEAAPASLFYACRSAASEPQRRRLATAAHWRSPSEAHFKRPASDIIVLVNAAAAQCPACNLANERARERTTHFSLIGAARAWPARTGSPCALARVCCVRAPRVVVAHSLALCEQKSPLLWALSRVSSADPF